MKMVVAGMKTAIGASAANAHFVLHTRPWSRAQRMCAARPLLLQTHTLVDLLVCPAVVLWQGAGHAAAAR